MKRSLVLSGGSIKGAFQAGAIKAFTDHNYSFNNIYGISVGSLNGAFMTDRAAKQNVAIDRLNWKTIGEQLREFWKQNIRKPEDVVRKRKGIGIIFSSLFNNFKGLVDTSPLHKLVRRELNVNDLMRSPVGLRVGAVNISDGKITYAEPNVPDFIDYVLASTAIPFMMPVVNIAGDEHRPFLDGGIRDVAPLKKAIDTDPDEIVCISCHSKELGGKAFNSGKLMSLIERIMDIVVNEIVTNDLEWAQYINPFLPADGSPKPEEPLKGYRKINIIEVRPKSPIGLDLEKFSSTDIQELMDSGYSTAEEIIGGISAG